MKKAKYFLLLIAVASLSSCGLFRKSCGCPHFGKVNPHSSPVRSGPQYS